jgi:hypothetical protein
LSFLILQFLWACTAEDIDTIPYSTARIGVSQKVSKGETTLKIYHNREECEDLIVALNYRRPSDQKMSEEDQLIEATNCMPWFDRKNGEVQLSFSLLYNQNEEDPIALPLEDEYIDIAHNNRDLRKNQDTTIALYPHEPSIGSQLYLLIIDASGSMNTIDGTDDRTRMDKVRKALLSSSVQKAFFPEGSNNRLVIYTFTAGDPKPLGGTFRMISSKKEYKKLIRMHLQSSSGYTHLYNSIAFGLEQLKENAKIKTFLGTQEASPTLLVLTDGFNNITRSDRCSSNAKPLQELVGNIVENQDPEKSLLMRSRIYTVGLGRKIRKNVRFPNNYAERVDPKVLCGKYRNIQIDGDLENRGIDNVSLEWIAKVGGGQSFVSKDEKGLANAFIQAASLRYKWFELRYKVSPTWLRETFVSKIQIKTLASSTSEITIYPHAWIDGPTGKIREDGWTDPRKSYHASVLFMNIIGLFLLLSILGAAFFNIRRNLMGRLRPPQ